MAPSVADKPDLEQREPAEETYSFPLSAQQRGLWFIQQLDLASATFNTPLVLRLWGDLDESALARALSEIHRRHEILRTTYLLTDEEPVQKVHPPRPVRLSQVDISGLPERDRGEVALRLRRADCERPVDLENGPIMRVTLLRLGEREYELHLITHHIANDGWSESILLRELTVLYETYRNGRPSPLPDLPIQYADYALWQREQLSDDLIATQLEYWRRKLGTLSALEMPRDYVAPAQTRWRGEMLRFTLPVDLSMELRNLAQREGVTLFVVLLAGFKLLLRRYSGQEDIAVGAVIANRNQRETQDLIGCFVNNLVLRTDLSGPLTFRELVKRVGATTLEAYEHQDVPFDRLVEELNPERYGGMPLIQALMVFQNTPSAELRLEGLQFEQLPMEYGYSYEHLCLSMHEESKALAGSLIYSTELFARASMERMLAYFERLLGEVSSAPDRDIDKISLLSAEEREQVLYRWNATEADYSAAGSRRMHQLFEQQAEISPEAVALTHEDRSLTYGRLNAESNQLAHYLREQGVGPDVRVAICVERGIGMVVALLAVLKAGGAYIPLDPAYPTERLAYLLEDSAPSVLLTDDGAKAALIGHPPAIPVLNLDSDATRWADRPECNPEPSASATAGRNLAYVIYTSGSTGAPKGVAIEHASAFNFICWGKSAFDSGLLQRTLFSTSLNFDLAVFECFVPLAVGAGIVIVDNALETGRSSPEATLINTVPSVMKTLVEAGGVPDSVRLVNLAGEPLRRELVERIFTTTQAEAVCNLYGPSETTTYSTWVRMRRGEDFAPHIGGPISNTQVYILNEKLEPSPVGVVGEIYIGGAGVARGYLNRPGLTAERFLPVPFGGRSGQRMYKTGDLGRWLPEGKIEFLGRNDFQVKIRGFRIELGEIEAALSAHPAVREAVVVARDEGEDGKRLVAYYTGEEAASEALRLHLSAALPNYMVPSAYVCLESLPLTPNGKLDRKALPAPDADAYASRDYQPPQGEVETMLAAIWADVLKLEQVGRHDNFFELGGHSLLAVRLIARARKALGVEVTIGDLFSHPVLADLARNLENVAQAELPPLTPVERDGPLPLSFAQQRLWFLVQMEGASQAYHIPFALHLRGRLDGAALRRSLDRILARHESLRTTFALVDGEPLQRIAPAEDSHFRMAEHDLSQTADPHDGLRRLAAEEAGAGFDLEAGPLIRGRLIRLAEDEHSLLVTMHHIVFDGWSTGVFFSELSRLYGCFLRDEPDPLPEPGLQYADYAVWQRRWIEGEVLRRQAEYWKATLAGAPTLLELPADRPRPARQDYAGDFVEVALDGELAAGLRALSRRHHTTLYLTLLASWAALLYRLSGQSDLVIGTPVANRGRVEIEELIGFFVNTLALRLDMSGSPTAGELLKRVKAQALAAQQHQDIPFEQVVEIARPARSLAHSPLFQVMFVWRTGEEDTLELAGLEVGSIELEPGRVSKFDLTLALQDDGEAIVGGVEYATSLFDRETVRRYLGYYEQVLREMVAAPERRISELELMSREERQRLLVEWNGTEQEYARESCVHELFEAQAQRTPAAIAVEFEETQLSYGELNARANQLACYLRRQGVGAESLVGVLMERSAEMVVALLGTLKAGGAYVPLDAQYPPERLSFMLEDAGVTVLLTQERLAGRLAARLAADDAHVLYLDTQWGRLAGESAQNLGRTATAENLAYVIYTSGSTGHPKGVMITHASVANLLSALDHAVYHPLTERTENEEPQQPLRVSLNAPVSFDSSVKQWTRLTRGATLCLVPDAARMDTEALLRFINESRLEVLDCTPSQLRMLPAAGLEREAPSLRGVLVGGEALDAALWAQLRGQDRGGSNNGDGSGSAAGRRVNYYNVYGPTECTVDATACLIDEARAEPTIGRPIGNVQVYVLDARQRPVPVGVAGELYIGGAGVGRGYLNRPELTAEKFVPDPFSTTAGARLYRTGDLARFLPTGEVEFLGRVDHQVKMRGFRIELGEIEAALCDEAEIAQAVVEARSDAGGERRLVAYVVAAKGQPLPAWAELRERLRRRLPDYMTPSAWVELESFPLTTNGKLDRRALPAPAGQAYATPGYEAPQGEIETTVASIWADALKLERVGRRDSFFDLGGHSLLGVRVISRLRQDLSVEASISDLFEHPVLADFALALESATHSERLPITRVERSMPLPLSFAQQRLWFLVQMEGASQAYHIPFALHLRGRLDGAALRRSLDRILARHESLRTTFALVDGEPLQRIAPAEDSHFRMAEHDLSQTADPHDGLRRLAAEEAGAGFDLEAGPLIRGRLIRLAEDEHSLLVTMHHIVFDGWSTGVFFSELSRLYGCFLRDEPDPLPEPGLQYADYAVWQRRWIEGEVLRRQAEYWKATLAGAPTLLELPADRPRPARQDYAGDFVEVALDGELAAGLRALSRRHHTTLYLTLLASWAALLYRLSGQPDLVIGTPVANRGRVEIEELIGFFVNTLALRLDMSGSPTAGELLKRVKAQALAAQQHQDIPFEQVVEIARPARSLAHSPLFQVMFVWQSATEETLELAGLEVESLKLEPEKVSKFDLTLALQDDGEAIVGGVEYATSLFDRETVQRYLGYWQTLLRAMVADEEQTLDRWSLLGESERQQLLKARGAVVETGGKRLHEGFERQARNNPRRCAVSVNGSERIDYEELDQRANQLANWLRREGVKPGERVGLWLDRSIEMSVGMLGVLKAGGAYVPLEPEHPQERLKWIIEDVRPRMVLTSERYREAVGEAGGRAVGLDGVERIEIERESRSKPEERIIDGREAAYIIYTSGSTGRPKGVVIGHAAIVNHMEWMQAEYPLVEDDRVLQKTGISFDASVWEFYAPWTIGAEVVMAPVGAQREPGKLIDVVRQEGVTILQAVPSLLRELVKEREWERCESLRRMYVGGEELESELARRARGERGLEVVNLYGPTEASIDATSWKYEDEIGRTVCIGRPIRNTEIYILDEQMEPVPIGVAGEIYIGGAGLAEGYWRQPRLTAERFLPHPFDKLAGARLYRTGDLGRWRHGGVVEFLGRLDHQVKLRGYRIELGEIEAAFCDEAEIAQAVVEARSDAGGERRLVAYVVAAKGQPLPAWAELRERLRRRLPDYMTPSAWVELESFPLTTNGKLDRRALPAPAGQAYATPGYEAPQGEIETALAEIWAGVLGIEQAGRHDNFFEVGGHSLLAVKLKALVRQRLGFELPQSIFFTQPTIAGLAAALDLSDLRRDGPLVLLRLTGERAPLFLVHAIGGGLFPYRELTNALPPLRPIYGLERPGFESGEVEELDIEQLAARYLEPVRRRQPHGPYAIAGWSFGGLVAFEMARQLRSAGERVAFLGLIDAQPPLGHVRSRMHRLALKMGVTADGLYDREAQALGVALDEAAGKRLRAMLDAHLGAMLRYSPGGEIDAERVVLFRAAASGDGSRTSRSRTGWQSLSRRPIEQHTVAGDHYSIMKLPQAAFLAEDLARAMGDL